MTVVPTGTPAHVRANDITSFGGDLDKRNYLNIGVIDPKTDESAEQKSRMFEIVQCVEKTAPFAVLTYHQLDGYLPVLTYYKSFYAPTPTFISYGDGYCSLTFASSYTDTYGVSAPFSIGNVDAQVLGIRVTPAVLQTDVSGNVVYIKVTGATGGPTVMVRIW